MVEVNSVIKEISDKLNQSYVQDKDVWMFERIQIHRNEPYITQILKLVSKDSECTKELWESIADICFEVLGKARVTVEQREEALEVLAAYRNHLKCSSINMNIEQIPDDILKFERSGRKMHSKLHEPLHGTDLKIMQLHNEEELKLLKNDAITLVAIIQKRLEQIKGKKEQIKYFQKIYKEPFTRRQMIKLEIVKFRQEFIENVRIPTKQVLFSKSLPFKKSDKSTITAVNEIIKILNRDYDLKIQLI